MKYKLLSLIISAFALAGLSAPLTFAVQDAGGGGGGGSTCSAGADNCAEKTAFPINGKTSNVSIRDLAIEIIRFLSVGVGIAVVGGIAYGGITYSMAQGNPSGTQKAIAIITNSIVGLMLYLLMFALLQFLVPGGVLK